jgi:hypothetical protein
MQKHGLLSDSSCALCDQAPESIEHLLLTCVFSRELWSVQLRRVGFQFLTPAQEGALADWWLRRRKKIFMDHRKGFDSFVVLMVWLIWKERNARVFHGASRTVAQLASSVLDEGRL